MIEVNAFLAVFTTQILALSVLYPAWFIRYMRRQATLIPAERLVQLYPGADLNRARERFLSRYRALNTGIAVLGLLLLGWLFRDMQRPDWSGRPVEVLVGVYAMVQALLPLCMVVWNGVRFSQVYKCPLPRGKRTASLRRRGLFDFVAPFVVVLAGLGYFLFATFVIYIQQNPLLGVSGLIYLGGVTLVYVLQAFVVYAVMYGKKPHPFEAYPDRVRTIGLVVRSCVYSCIACVVFLSLILALGLLNLQRWEPFALSSFLVITALLSLMGMTAPPGPAEADGSGSDAGVTPGARELHPPAS